MSIDEFAKHFQWLTDEKTIKALEKMKKAEAKKKTQNRNYIYRHNVKDNLQKGLKTSK